MKALKKGYKRASIQLPPILSHFSAKLDQSQSAFFFGTEEVLYSTRIFVNLVLCELFLQKIYYQEDVLNL